MTAAMRCADCRRVLMRHTARFLRHPAAPAIITATYTTHAKACPVGALRDIHATWAKPQIRIKYRGIT